MSVNVWLVVKLSCTKYSKFDIFLFCQSSVIHIVDLMTSERKASERCNSSIYCKSFIFLLNHYQILQIVHAYLQRLEIIVDYCMWVQKLILAFVVYGILTSSWGSKPSFAERPIRITQHEIPEPKSNVNGMENN